MVGYPTVGSARQLASRRQTRVFSALRRTPTAYTFVPPAPAILSCPDKLKAPRTVRLIRQSAMPKARLQNAYMTAGYHLWSRTYEPNVVKPSPMQLFTL